MSGWLGIGPFRIDLGNGLLWGDTDIIHLTPKAFTLLRHFVMRPQEVITRDELFAVGWSGTAVHEAALTVCIGELRRALGDNAKQPRYIETIHRRGYRWIAPIVMFPSTAVIDGLPSSPQLPAVVAPPSLIARDAEFAHLQKSLVHALQGIRQLVFVTGEPGIGKTALVDAFTAEIGQLESSHKIWISRGQCIQHYGQGEPYLPILEALGRLCCADHGHELIDILRHQAPTWLAQMPGLSPAAEQAELKLHSAVADRMLRELTEAVDTISTLRPLVWVFEDLH